MPIDPLGYAVLAVARDAINQRFGNDVAPTTLHPALDQAGATFVTLTQHGTLRGCIGSLEAYRPLATDVAENAVAAAFADPRFSPLSLAEWKETRIEVSLLDAAEEMRFVDENDAIAQLRPGIDGLILRHYHPTIPPKVEYELTELGCSLRAPVRALAGWALENLPAIDAAREAFDSRTGAEAA